MEENILEDNGNVYSQGYTAKEEEQTMANQADCSSNEKKKQVLQTS